MKRPIAVYKLRKQSTNRRSTGRCKGVGTAYANSLFHMFSCSYARVPLLLHRNMVKLNLDPRDYKVWRRQSKVLANKHYMSERYI